jgi:hypothetical protein
VHWHTSRPMFDACDAGAILPPSFDGAALHRLDAEVLVVAGRNDHAVDYRSSIALAAHYPRGELLILDDDHMFSGCRADGSLWALTRAFLAHGPASEEYARARRDIEPHRWRE